MRLARAPDSGSGQVKHSRGLNPSFGFSPFFRLSDYQRVYGVYLRPVVMVSVQNIRASDRYVLASARNRNLVRIALARRYRICLARRIHTDNLDHQITVLILIVSTIREVAVSLV